MIQSHNLSDILLAQGGDSDDHYVLSYPTSQLCTPLLALHIILWPPCHAKNLNVADGYVVYITEASGIYACVTYLHSN